ENDKLINSDDDTIMIKNKKEEINESYLELFGYTENLKALIMKKEILSALKDINLLRKNSQMYLTEELNKVEKEIELQLDEQLEENYAGPSNTKFSSHDYVRKNAEGNLKLYNASMKEIMTRSFKINTYNIGELVKIKIPKEDRGKTDRTHLPCKTLNSKKISRKSISLREAIRLQSTIQNESQIHLQVVENGFEVTCKCPKTTRDTLRYICKKLNRKCNLSCHLEKE
ncbi:8943_t:CDS:2, partial [Funneliformis geosporum]